MEEELDVVIRAVRVVQVLGEEAACLWGASVIQAMVLLNRGMTVGTPDVVTAISMVKTMKLTSLSPFTKKNYQKDNTETYPCKTLGQKLYVDSVKQRV